ncbi:MAG TPA: hypothetical protein VMD76_13450 [Candidatus Sulfotelmatobacter sp.]|nr:hypothetical protein [Candidatus Sulfotelmatobacter sp.]
MRRQPRSSGGTLARLVELRAEAPDQLMVLSSEILEETKKSQAKQIRSAFTSRNGNEQFLIVFVIRDLAQLIPSIYAQRVKEGRTNSDFDDFFTLLLKERRINFFKTVRRWAAVFGWDNVRVRVLDPKQLTGGDLIDDFLRVVGFEVEKLPAPLVRPGISNVAPGWRVIEALRALRNGEHGLPHDHRLLEACSRAPRWVDVIRAAKSLGNQNGWNKDRGSFLTRVQAEACLAVYGENVAALNAHLPHDNIPMPLDLTSSGFQAREFLPRAACIPPYELRKFYDELGQELKNRKKERSAKLRNSSAHAPPSRPCPPDGRPDIKVGMRGSV